MTYLKGTQESPKGCQQRETPEENTQTHQKEEGENGKSVTVTFSPNLYLLTLKQLIIIKPIATVSSTYIMLQSTLLYYNTLYSRGVLVTIYCLKWLLA